MLSHIEQLIALVSLEYNLDCLRLEEKPDYLEAYTDCTKFHKEMEDGINLVILADGHTETFHVFSEEETPLVSLKFDDFELAYEEMEIYADNIAVV